jgi:hypothetical protein
VLNEADDIGGTQASQIKSCLPEVMIKEAFSEAQCVIDRPLAKAPLLYKIGLKLRQQCDAFHLRHRRRQRPHHANIDKMLGKPARDIVGANGLAVLSRYFAPQSFSLTDGQTGRLYPLCIHHLPKLPDDRAVGRDGAGCVVRDGEAFGERFQVRIDAGFQNYRHVVRAPCWWSLDYAEWARRDHAANRTFSMARGVNRITALWVSSCSAVR